MLGGITMGAKRAVGAWMIAAGSIAAVGGAAAEYVTCDAGIVASRDELMLPICDDGESFPDDLETTISYAGFVATIAGGALRDYEPGDEAAGGPVDNSGA